MSHSVTNSTNDELLPAVIRLVPSPELARAGFEIRVISDGSGRWPQSVLSVLR